MKFQYDTQKELKIAIYCPQGSGTLRQQLLIMHGIAWYYMTLHGIAWYCMVLHGIAWYCTFAWYCMAIRAPDGAKNTIGDGGSTAL